jgi:sodium/potassium-transporting ATPase subunit alpha
VGVIFFCLGFIVGY